MKLAFDFETHLVSPEQPVPPPVVMSWAVPGNADLIHAKDRTWCKSLQNALRKHQLIGANVPFDLTVAAEADDRLTLPTFEALEDGRVWDVLTAEKMWDIAHGQYGKFTGRQSGYSLAAVALRRLGVKLDKNTWRLRYHELENTPLDEWPAEAVEYPKNDAISTLLVEEDQQKRRAEFREENDGLDVFEDLHRQVRAKMALHLMSVWGIMVDQANVEKFDKQVTADWEAARDRLKLVGLVRADGTRDTKAAQARMEKAGGTKEAAGGALSLDAEACADSGDPVLVDYAAFGSLLKLKSTYIQPLRGTGSFPIHAFFEELRETSRTSCSRPNLQNLPRAPGVRECYRARPGCVFIKRDYSRAEISAMAQVCLELGFESALAEAVNEGSDVHNELAMKIGGLEHRQAAKNGNFAFLGGAGAERFVSMTKQSTGVVMELDYAAEVRDAFFSTWPEVRAYHRWVGEQCGEGRGNARDELSGFCRGDISFTEYANFKFQTRVAACAKDAGWRITKRQFTQPDSALYGTHCVVFVHDEWILEVPEDRAEACDRELAECMAEAAKFWMPRVRCDTDGGIMGTHWRKS